MNLHGLKRKLKEASQRLRFLETTNKGNYTEKKNLSIKIRKLRDDVKTRREVKNVTRKKRKTK